MMYVRYINSRYKDLTQGKIYEILEPNNVNNNVVIRNDYGDIIRHYSWFYKELNFIHITHKELRNEVITEILK